MCVELNWFGWRQRIMVLMIQIGKLRPKKLTGTFTLSDPSLEALLPVTLLRSSSS